MKSRSYSKKYVLFLLSACATAIAAPAFSAGAVSSSPVLPESTAMSDLIVKSSRLAPGEASVYIPASSVSKPEDIGKFMHTNVRILVPTGEETIQSQSISPQGAPPFAGYGFETPASFACIYNLVTPTPGCDPNSLTVNASGGSKVIAIVDAFHNSSALADLKRYSTQFGLPAPNLQVVYAAGTQPPAADLGWALESSLDLQIAHALAPSAKLILVEAKSNSDDDLMAAEDRASALVAAAGGGQVSNSWGGSEFPEETSLDTHFSKAKVVYFASTGDGPGTSWPAASSKVVAVGGTGTSRNPFTGQFITETAWADAGGGLSFYVPRPSYQSAIAGLVGSSRGIPDVSFDSNPYTGAWAYCGAACGGGGWFIAAGTSLASPAIAAITNSAGGFAASSAAELTKIYSGLGTSKFFDAKIGICGPYAGFIATTGWDPCTGVGSPRTKAGL